MSRARLVRGQVTCPGCDDIYPAHVFREEDGVRTATLDCQGCYWQGEIHVYADGRTVIDTYGRAPCRPCASGDHAGCLAEAGDCINLCHPTKKEATR